ncbi:MAG: TonB-dependent receptor family protein [Ilyomonas sp.]
MKKIKHLLAALFVTTLSFSLHAQTAINLNDTMPTNMLDSIKVSSFLHSDSKQYLPEVVGMNVFAGKKTDLIQLNASKGNMSQNLARTLFAQIPGLNTWEMDGAGTQVNIGTRGTDAHRSIEMNMRQNGYNTNSDIFGYPENHYTLPMQAIQQVQLVRGSAALQFGSQFGGMMNYILKTGDSTKPLSIESEQTVGSNNLFNSYNAVGGTVGKLNYYAYYDNRSGDGWRDNAAFKYHAYYVNLNYKFNEKASLALQFSRMDYVQQIAGGLTDKQFEQNPKQSERARNYFEPEINIPAVIFKYAISENTKLKITSSSLFGQRNSVQFINAPNIADTFNTTINSYNPRQVDRDYYSGFSTEARLLHNYSIGNTKSILAAGLRYSNELTKRRQKGVGTTGSDFDLSLAKPYGIDLRFRTINYAAFAENVFQLSNKFSFTPGVRYEVINTTLNGVINKATDEVHYKGNRNFPLFGAGIQYKVNRFSEVYGNISQAYRPYLYSNVTPADRLDVIDSNLKDSKGYDVDLGYRGHYKNIVSFDVNAFYLFYGNKIGLVSKQKENNVSYLFATNVGNAVAKGVEAYVELSLLPLLGTESKTNDISIFNSLAYDHARYTKAIINKGGVNTSIEGNYVENTPDWINKTGLSLQHKNIIARVLYSYTSESYNDAFNTIYSDNGVIGIIPSYHIWDFSFEYTFKNNYRLSGGINNFTNEKYFNRRITMYPGPGILPADERTFYVSFGIKI